VDSIYGKNRAALISRLYIISRAIEEIDRCVWFFLYGAGITERGGDYGLLRLAQEDGGYPNPRPEFCAYATTSKFLLGVNNPQKIDIHQDIPIYLFEKGKGSRIALWSLQKDPVLFQMNLPTSAKCYDIIGRSFTPEKEGNLSILTLTESPIFIVDKTKGVEIYRKVLSEAKYTLPPVKIFNTFSKIDKMEIKIVNQLNKDIEGKIKVEVPEFWKVIELEKDVILSPKEEKTIEIQLQVIKPIPQIPGDFSISFTSPILPKISITTKPQFFKVEKFTPVIDGNLDEYQGLSPIELNKEEYISPPLAGINGDWTGLNDLSVKAWTTYDEENFYFAAEVTDDKFIQENTGTWIWANDSFQIAFDTLNDGKLSPGSGYKEDDYEFGIALTPVGPQVFQWAGKGAEGGRLVASAKLIVKRQGDKTIYELSLPWSDLSLLKPEKGRVFGFNFTAIDSDKSGGAEYWMGLTEGIAGGKNPSLFHNFFLQ
ncbi:MAG TPA: sugar-binding protein, partial [Candidatus Ratteibacteria bacterium]|nr:sugar-binding protein [Candidatus Ratteibacteria bacterium]